MEKLHEIQMSVSLKLYWNTAATICLNIIYDFLCAQTAQLRSVAKATAPCALNHTGGYKPNGIWVPCGSPTCMRKHFQR